MKKWWQVSVLVDVKVVLGLLCSAFEGGSNYWARIDEISYPDGFSAVDYADGGKAREGQGPWWARAQLVPTQGGHLLMSVIPEVGDEPRRELRLDGEAIQRGLQVMAEKYPRHMADALTENGDATTGDVFLQCCLFGEVVYG